MAEQKQGEESTTAFFPSGLPLELAYCFFSLFPGLQGYGL
jgi:hypothetical protein